MKSDPLFSEIDEWTEELISRWASKERKPIISSLEKDMMYHIKDKGVHCPFCGFTGMERHPIDATHSQQGKLKQKRTCWQCGKAWTIEYNMVRVKYGPNTFDKLGEVNKKAKTKRQAIINELLRQARNLNW